MYCDIRGMVFIYNDGVDGAAFRVARRKPRHQNYQDSPAYESPSSHGSGLHKELRAGHSVPEQLATAAAARPDYEGWLYN